MLCVYVGHKQHDHKSWGSSWPTELLAAARLCGRSRERRIGDGHSLGSTHTVRPWATAFDVLEETTASSMPEADNNKEEVKPKCKICCACPETKTVRDECIIRNGEEACQDKIEAHKVCLRGMGFKV